MKYNVTIVRRFTSAETATVEVDAESPEDAREKVEDAYSEGEYEGRADVEWEEDADEWDAYEHEIVTIEESEA